MGRSGRSGISTYYTSGGEKNIPEAQVKAKMIDIVNKAKAAADKLLKNTGQRADVLAIEAEAMLQATRASTQP
jgi:hypothetical protein